MRGVDKLKMALGEKRLLHAPQVQLGAHARLLREAKLIAGQVHGMELAVLLHGAERLVKLRRLQPLVNLAVEIIARGGKRTVFLPGRGGRLPVLPFLRGGEQQAKLLIVIFIQAREAADADRLLIQLPHLAHKLAHVRHAQLAEHVET